MFIVYLFVLTYNWKQLETRKINIVGCYLYDVRLFHSENKCPSAILIDMNIAKNSIEWQLYVADYEQYDVINNNCINI